MAWSWSYTAEAINNIREQIANQKREWLEVCWAENKAAYYEDGEDSSWREPELDSDKYEEFLEQASDIATDILADAIFEFAEKIATCSNGAFEAYCCPWGCHTVTPDPVMAQN